MRRYENDTKRFAVAARHMMKTGAHIEAHRDCIERCDIKATSKTILDEREIQRRKFSILEGPAVCMTQIVVDSKQDKHEIDAVMCTTFVAVLLHVLDERAWPLIENY
jgi:hypothetical protein